MLARNTSGPLANYIMDWSKILIFLGLLLGVAHGQTREERLAKKRLPGDLRPYHYYVELQADIYDANRSEHNYTGITEINFECVNLTNNIYINVKDYVPSRTSLNISLAPDNNVSAPVPVITDSRNEADNQFYILVLANNLVVGARYRLRLAFERQLNKNGAGFYQLSYVANFETRWLAATQFEASDARAAFPCFDEPEYKATFDIVLVRKSEYRTLSNMHTIRNDPRPDGWIADVYARTPVMATFTLACVVCDFQYRERVSSRGVASRVWARADQLEHTGRALAVAVELIEWYERYTGINYPLNKLDHIALPKPNNRGGAMENWGLVTYGEPALLFSETESDVTSWRGVYSTMSHEVAHMWFGNLVTCAWWSEIWLNEGFASYFYYLPYDELLGWPEFQLQATFTVMDALRLDQNPNSPPIRQEVDTPLNFGPPDRITYSKGGSFTRMLRNAVGLETFKRALQRYLTRHQYSTATTEELWTAFQEQADTDNVTEPDGRTRLTLRDKFDPWVRQAGFPLVEFDRSTPFGILARLNQTRFTMFMDSQVDTPSPWNYQWWVPVTVYHEDQPEKTRDTQYYLPPATGLDVTSGLPPPSKLLVANVDQVGFYRLVYDQATQDQLLATLEDQVVRIPTMNRAAMLDDMFARVRAFYMPETEALNFTRYMAGENQLLPWRAIVGHIGYHDIMFMRESLFGDHERYWRLRVDPVYSRTRNVQPGDIMGRMLRQTLTFWSCAYNNADCIQAAVTAFNDWWLNPITRPIEADLQTAYMCTAVSAGEEFEWNVVYALYRAFGNYHTEQRYLLALACSRDYYLLERYMVAMENGDIPGSGAIFLGLTALGQEIVWRHLREQWTDSPFGNVKLSMLVAQAIPRNKMEELEEFENFALLNPPVDEDEERVFNFTRAVITNNVRWMSINRDPIAAWLRDNLPGSSDKHTSQPFASGAGGSLMSYAIYTQLEELQQDLGRLNADLPVEELVMKAVQDLFPNVNY